MHISDGALGPQTWISCFILTVPLWKIGISKIKKIENSEIIPSLALGAAFSFVIMLFNIPIPFGTTGHAIGTALLSILFGPWEAFILVSIALGIQALLFGDGGITAFGANCINIALVPAFSSSIVYSAINGKKSLSSRTSIIAATISGYISILLAALTTGIMLGIQPMLNHDSTGTSIYFPYGLNITIPAMMIQHALVFGWVEAIVTGFGIKLLAKDTYLLTQITGKTTEN